MKNLIFRCSFKNYMIYTQLIEAVKLFITLINSIKMGLKYFSFGGFFLIINVFTD